MIAHNKPLITLMDRQAVERVLSSGWIAEGPEVKGLEATFCDINFGGKAVAVSSGTAALFLALRAGGVLKGQRVALPSYSCSALLNAILMCEAVPVLVDVREDDFTIDLQRVKELDQLSAVIAVHTFGASANIEGLKKCVPLVIEDCCQSLGGPQGRLGDFSVYSFYATKIITGGQGGLVWSADVNKVEWIRDYREFDCCDIYKPRFNFQMTDIQAAMINSQMTRLNELRSIRSKLREKYKAAAHKLLHSGWRLQEGFDGGAHLPYRVTLLAPSHEEFSLLQRQFKLADIQTIVPIEAYELLHRYLGESKETFPVSENLAQNLLSLPCYPALEAREIEAICKVLERAG